MFRNSMGSYNGNGSGGATGAFSRIPTLSKRPSPSLSTTQPDEKTSQVKSVSRLSFCIFYNRLQKTGRNRSTF